METSGKVPRRVLVVDDDPLVADSIRRMLVFQGYRVETARSGEEALALFSESAFDLTLLDYEMPGMKGDQLATAIKNLVPNQPVIMFTGYGEAVQSSDTRPKAVDAVLGKPFDLQALRQTLARLLPSEAAPP
jgi:two-component system response regulator MprA